MPNAIRTGGGWTHHTGAGDDETVTYTLPNAVQTVGGWQVDHTPPVDLPPVEESTPPPGDDVPTGRVDEVLAWVGDDADRADRAWGAEVDGKRRRTLLTMLAHIADRSQQ